jgi:hypothetical protein
MAIPTLTQALSNVSANTDKLAIRKALLPIVDRFNSCAHTSAGLVIKTGGSTLAKTGSSAWYGTANGVSLTIAGATDMPALSGSITAAYYNVFCFFVDSAGTLTSAMGREGATLAAVDFPDFPVGKALVGYLIVTYASAFVGGTTALDTATTVYVSPIGPFNPNALL